MESTLKFTKMHGIGNDYIYFFHPERLPLAPEEIAQRLSRRHFSVGSDGIIIIDKSERADSKMRMFNADGSEAEICGNGLRCVAKYLYDRDLVGSATMTIQTGKSIISAKVIESGLRVSQVELRLPEPTQTPESIPLTSDHPFIDEPLSFTGPDGSSLRVTTVNLGNPHCVIFIQTDLADFPVHELGHAIEHSPLFPQRTNVEFVRVRTAQHIDVRVWERGSGETMACGSGACASVVAGILTGRLRNPCSVSLPGGDLSITWQKGKGIVLSGPAEEVFEGQIPLSFFEG